MVALAPLDPALLIGLIGIAIALFFGLRGARTELGGKFEDMGRKLSKIEEHTRHISDIKSTVSCIKGAVEGWKSLMQLGIGTGTVSLELRNLGKVEVTAEPGSDWVTYRIRLLKPVLKESFLIKKIKETEFVEEEKSYSAEKP